MAIYQFRAVDAAGELQSGRLEAATLELAAESLNQRALMPVELREAGTAFGLPGLANSSPLGRRNVSRRDVVLMTQQLASLARSGLTIDRALAIASQLAETGAQRRLIDDLSQSVRRGSSFAEALDAHQSEFPGYYLSMVRAGEASGALPDILLRLSELMTCSEEIRQKVVSALIYPIILLTMIGLTLVMILTFVLPRFESIFQEAGSQLPLPTRIVMAIGSGFQSYGWLLAGLAAAALLGVRHALRQRETRIQFDSAVLRLRLIGPVISKIETARFARALGTLTAGGMPVPSSLRIARGSLINTALQSSADEVLQGVIEGESFADRLTQAGRFPILLTQMARVGEETGHLHEGLLDAANMLDADAQRVIERGLTVLVPVVTILMGALVAALIGSVLVGILSVNDLAL
jgi:general secretion pathway protein F